MRDKQGIPLLQMFAQCALHGAALEAAQSCIIWDAAIHQASRSVDLEVSFFLSYPARPGRCHPAEYLLGLRPAGAPPPAPAPTGGAAHSGAGSRAGFRTHSSRQICLGRRRRR